MNNEINKENGEVDIIDVFEEMLFQRAAKGIRPVLYVSSLTDLECNMVMLLDENAEEFSPEWTKPSQNGARHPVTLG
jgi:hypothetical protein